MLDNPLSPHSLNFSLSLSPSRFVFFYLSNNGNSNWARYEQRGSQQRAQARNGSVRGLRNGSAVSGSSGQRVYESDPWGQRAGGLSKRQRNGAIRSANSGGIQAQQTHHQQQQQQRRIWNAEYNPQTGSYDLDHTD